MTRCIVCDRQGPLENTLESDLRELHRALHEFWRSVRREHHQSDYSLMA